MPSTLGLEPREHLRVHRVEHELLAGQTRDSIRGIPHQQLAELEPAGGRPSVGIDHAAMGEVSQEQLLLRRA